MGYYTTYTLKWAPRPDYQAKPSCKCKSRAGSKFCPECGIEVGPIPLERVISEYITARKDEFGTNPDGTQQDPSKWYQAEEEMREMSAEIRNVLFTLHGEGEETGDIWDAFFLNGKSQKEKAVLTINPFDESKLK